MKSGASKVYIDSDSYEISEGDLLFVFPNKIHRFEDIDSENRYELFIINPDIVSELAQKITTESPIDPIIRNAAQNPRISSLVSILTTTHSFPTSCKDFLMRGYLLSFFAEILEMIPMKNGKTDEHQAMRAVVQYCSQNFTKDLSLSILEEELHLSKYYISHLFGDKLGICFNDYVNSLRVSEACRFLRTTDMSITEISDASGFGTLRTFNRAFIKQMGVSPSDYKHSRKDDASVASIPQHHR
jgi:AraC-like DNA-binding protein